MKAVALAALLATGCSAIFVHRAGPDPEPATWPRCTEHVVFPLIDTAYAALAGVLTVTAATDQSTYGGLALIVSLPMLLGYGGSAIYGFTATAHCSRVRSAYEAAAAAGR